MRRIILVAIVTAMLVAMLPSTALAWCNGPTRNGNRGDGYGTHDWILDRAIKIAGVQGTWVNRTTALVATDDPDSKKTPVTYHWFKETGSCRGAPQMVSEYYHKAVVAYRNGDRALASRYLGVMSHYFSDITQPFHASGKSAPYGALHHDYEFAVEDYTNKPTANRSWVTPRATVPVTDIRAKTVSAALDARKYFPKLLAGYKRSRTVRTGMTNWVTKRMLSRAANDLADIISTIPSGAGEATVPANVNIRLSTTAPKRSWGVRLGTLVTLTDANGKGLDAVGVKFVWYLPSGTVTWLTFTDANGYIYRYQTITSVPLNRPANAYAFITVNGKSTTYRLPYTPIW